MADDKHNIQGTPDGDVEADTASGGAPDDSDQSETTAEPETTDEDDHPVDNPSGG